MKDRCFIPQMITPLVFTLALSEVSKGKLIGEIIPITIDNEPPAVDSVIISKNGEKAEVCTDYFDRLCPDCSLMRCPYNPKNGRERV